MIIGIAALAIALCFLLVQRLPNGSITAMFPLVARLFGLVATPTSTTTTAEAEEVRKKVAAPTLTVTKEEERPPKIQLENGKPSPPRIQAGSVKPSPPVIIQQEEEEEDDDEAPAFPALNSAQRASGPSVFAKQGNMLPPPIPIRSTITATTTTAAQQARSSPSSSLGSDGSTPRQGGFMAPPPVPQQQKIPSLSPSQAGMMPPPPSISFARGLQPQRGGLMPPSTGAAGVAAGSGLHLPNKPKTSSSRKKVILTPGHSPLDWARLQSSNADLRTGVPADSGLLKVPPSELAKHKSKEDAWTVIEDRVYSISRYLAFHPGGEKELMRVAGRDGTKLYMKTHPWVNYENMLRGCLIGVFVPEPVMVVQGNKEEGGGGLEDMD